MGSRDNGRAGYVSDCGHEHDPDAWCWCVPQDIIDADILRTDMLVRGFNPDDIEDINRYEAEFYGKHDAKNIGWGAWRIAVPQIIADDRVPVGFGMVPSVLLGGKHRIQT